MAVIKLERPESGGVNSTQTQIYLEDKTEYGNGNAEEHQTAVIVVGQMLGKEENIDLKVPSYDPINFTNIPIDLKDDGVLAAYGFLVYRKGQITINTSHNNYVLYDTVSQRLQKVQIINNQVTYVNIDWTELIHNKNLIYISGTIYYDIIAYQICKLIPELYYKAFIKDCKNPEQFKEVVRDIWRQTYIGAPITFGFKQYERTRDIFYHISKLVEKSKHYY